jgi:hypothetical protein
VLSRECQSSDNPRLAGCVFALSENNVFQFITDTQIGGLLAWRFWFQKELTMSSVSPGYEGFERSSQV